MWSLDLPVNQHHLENVLKHIFPKNSDILLINNCYNARKAASIKNPLTGACLELDIWYPSHKISFEFQDDYHYKTSWYSQYPLEFVQRKDSAKSNLVRKINETLVLVPYWWDGSEASLIATIQFQRPDLFVDLQNSSVPIMLNPPHGFYNDVESIPDVGQLMLASYPSETANASPNNQWWIGEKYDGIRCCWHPVNNQIYSRTGNILPIPQSIVNLGVGTSFVDGEIWGGRGCFSDCQQLLLSPNLCDVTSLRIIGFDDASPNLQSILYEQRFKNLLLNVSINHAVVISLKLYSFPTISVSNLITIYMFALRVLCENNTHLTNMLDLLVNEGSEGMILQKPECEYLRGRSNSLLKLKATPNDQEALVLNTNEDKSLMLQLPNGVEFSVNRTQYSLHHQPQKGDIVTFTHDSNKRRDIPVNPFVYRIRQDVTWETVISNYKTVQQSFNDAFQKISNYTAKPSGYWSNEGNRRKGMETLAERMNFDPLIAENWYTIDKKEAFGNNKDLRAIIQYHNGQFIDAIVDLFPEIEFDKLQFEFQSHSIWKELTNRRAVFKKFAAEHGFDPLIADNWHQFSRAYIYFTQHTKGWSILNHYNGSMIKALLHLFPNIGLDPVKFVEPSSGKHKKLVKVQENDRKQPFLEYARKKGFDPLIPDNWYKITYRDLKNTQGAAVLKHFNGSCAKALVNLFPNIGLDESKFRTPFKHWGSLETQREAFLNFAKLKGFDPLVLENWSSVKRQDYAPFKGILGILNYYKNNYMTAVLSIFPNLKSQKSKLRA